MNISDKSRKRKGGFSDQKNQPQPPLTIGPIKSELILAIGGNTEIDAKNIDILASTLVGEGNTSLTAEEEVTIAALSETSTSSHSSKKKGGFLGSKKSSANKSTDILSFQGAEVVSGGDLIIDAGKDVNVIASLIEAGSKLNEYDEDGYVTDGEGNLTIATSGSLNVLAELGL